MSAFTEGKGAGEGRAVVAHAVPASASVTWASRNQETCPGVLPAHTAPSCRDLPIHRREGLAPPLTGPLGLFYVIAKDHTSHWAVRIV